MVSSNTKGTEAMTTASDKQISFLTKLIEGKEGANEKIDATYALELIEKGELSKTAASTLISTLVALPWRPRESTPRVDVAEGFYRLQDGDIAVVKFNRAKTNKYAMRLVVGRHERECDGDHGILRDGEICGGCGGTMTPDPRGIGSYMVYGSDNGFRWDYERGLISKCADARALTLEEAAEFGRLYGACMVCGRTLTDPESIERGIGPICAGRF